MYPAYIQSTSVSREFVSGNPTTLDLSLKIHLGVGFVVPVLLFQLIVVIRHLEMDESSQQSVMKTDSQQTSDESQMSTDQDVQESQSQMDMSQSSDEDKSPISKHHKKSHEENPVSSLTDTPLDTQQDEDVCQNGHEVGVESDKEKVEQLSLEEDVEKEEEKVEQLSLEEDVEKEEEKVEQLSLEEDVEKEEEQDESHVDEEDYGSQFPDTLEGFKYAFNKDGQMRHIETGEPFKFDVKKNDHRYNQNHYEALGEVITNYVYSLLETEVKLKKVFLGDNANDESSFVFMSENALTTTDKLLVLIHGSGIVRAGQWARRLIINDCLDSGTQIPYIKRAMKNGYEVLVMNTNDNFRITSDDRRIYIKESSSPGEHGLHVWDKFIANTPVKHVAIVAHSYGGVVTLDLAMKRMDSFLRKVFAVALTDSVHYFYDRKGSEFHSWFIKNAINWVSSNEALDTVIDNGEYDCKRVSAGTTKHEETSWYSIDSIFKFLVNREKEAINPVMENASAPETEEATEDTPPKEDREMEDMEKGQHEMSEGQGTEIGGRETEV